MFFFAFYFSTGKLNVVGTSENSSVVQKASYLKGFSKTVKYKIHVLELNQQSQKEKRDLRKRMMAHTFCEKSVLYIGDVQGTGISEDLQDKI